MWFFQAPAALVGLVAIACLPLASAKPHPAPAPVPEELELRNATQLEKRQCAGTQCGYYAQLCCPQGEACGVNANNEAICVAGSGGVTSGWVYSTSTWVETDAITKTTVISYWVGATAQATPTATCAGIQSPCGSICCDSGYYCAGAGTCSLLGGGSSGGISATGSPTATVPFESPIATGASGVPIEQASGGGGLSGGAIAGIVIGVILGLLLLLLLCLYCCARALFDTIMAIFGLGKKRKHTHEETYIEEHHHSSGAGAGAGGGRRWYGQGPARPARPKKSSGGTGNMLGIGALLGGLALALGLKRKHDRRYDDKSTTVTGSSAYYSDYTSSSSASSSDRHTRHTRQSSRR